MSGPPNDEGAHMDAKEPNIDTNDYTCPECGETARTGTNGRIQLHVDSPDTKVLTVRAEVCVGCGRVTLYNTP
jgi:rRNA maturation protein Nop10